MVRLLRKLNVLTPLGWVFTVQLGLLGAATGAFIAYVMEANGVVGATIGAAAMSGAFMLYAYRCG